MCSRCNKKLNIKLNILNAAASIYTYVPPNFFLLPIRKVVALQIDRQTQMLCCLQLQTTPPPSPERKVTAPFLRTSLVNTYFCTMLNFFSFSSIFGQYLYSNCPRTLCLSHVSGSFEKIPNPMSSPGRTFQAYLFSKTNLKGRTSLSMRQV